MRLAVQTLIANAPLFGALAVVYLSGPMTGLPRWNFDAFDASAIALRSLGLVVLSPHEKDLDAGFDPDGDGAGFDLRAALEWDVNAVIEADAVVVLPGWENSPGCAIEVTVAEALGKPVFTIADVLGHRSSVDSPDFSVVLTTPAASA